MINTRTAWLNQSNDEENNSGFARQAMNMFAEARLAGIAVIVAAHPTKNPTGALSTMIAGSGQWAASAGRQFGIWVHEDANDPRRQIEAHGRQGWRNNLPRTVIEWDKKTNTYNVLGALEEVQDEEQRELKDADLEALLADFPDKSPMPRIEEHGTSLGFGRNQTRELVQRGLSQERLKKMDGEKPKSGPIPKIYIRVSQ